MAYGKWLLLKIPLCAKYVIIFRPDGFGVEKGVKLLLISGEFNDVESGSALSKSGKLSSYKHATNMWNKV